MEFTVETRRKTSRVFYIPLEILRIILEEVEPAFEFSTKDIASCSLVCKIWLQEARPILFCHIFVLLEDPILPLTTAEAALLRPVQEIAVRQKETAGSGWGGKSADSLLQFILSAPSLARLVHHLWLKRAIPLNFDEEDEEEPDEEGSIDEQAGDIDSEVFVRIIKAFPRLQSLRMDDTLISITGSGPLAQLQLKRLSISLPSRNKHDHIYTILDLLDLFASLEELDLDNIIGCSTDLTYDQIPRDLGITTLSLQYVIHSTGLLKALPVMISDSDFPGATGSLRSLEVKIETRQYALDCLDLFTQALPGLRHLGINLIYHDKDINACDFLYDLDIVGAATNLRSLNISCLLPLNRSDPMLLWILHVLEQLYRKERSEPPTSSFLQDFTLSFNGIHGFIDLSDEVLDDFVSVQDSLLRFSTLCSFKVEFCHLVIPGGEVDAVRSRIEARVPGLQKKGWLDVTKLSMRI